MSRSGAARAKAGHGKQGAWKCNTFLKGMGTCLLAARGPGSQGGDKGQGRQGVGIQVRGSGTEQVG